MFTNLQTYIRVFLYEISLEIDKLITSYNNDKVERKILFKSRIWWIPSFIIFYYLFLSYSDFILGQSLPVMEEHLLKFDEDLYWEEKSFIHVAGSLVFFAGYMFMTLCFVGIFRATLDVKYLLYNILFHLSYQAHMLYWHFIFIYSAHNLAIAPFWYNFIYWPGIFIQWAVDLEEDIDYKEDIEDASIRKKGAKPDVRWFTTPNLTAMEFILALGTKAEPIETPAETLKRYNIYRRRLQEGYGDEFAYQKPSKVENRITLREMFTSYNDFMSEINRWSTNFIRIIDKIGIYLEFFYNVISLNFFLIKNGYYKQPKALGNYEHYNPFFNLNYLGNYHDRIFAPMVLEDLPEAIKAWDTELADDRRFLPYISDVKEREAKRIQLDIDEKEFLVELEVTKVEIEEVMNHTKDIDLIFWSAFSKKITLSNELSTYKAKKFAYLLFTKKL